jgi:hypothetical protein
LPVFGFTNLDARHLDVSEVIVFRVISCPSLDVVTCVGWGSGKGTAASTLIANATAGTT